MKATTASISFSKLTKTTIIHFTYKVQNLPGQRKRYPRVLWPELGTPDYRVLLQLWVTTLSTKQVYH